MATRDISAEELDAFARAHLAYEVRMLVEQACELHARYPNGSPGAFTDATEDAILEAALPACPWRLALGTI